MFAAYAEHKEDESTNTAGGRQDDWQSSTSFPTVFASLVVNEGQSPNTLEESEDIARIPLPSVKEHSDGEKKHSVPKLHKTKKHSKKKKKHERDSAVRSETKSEIALLTSLHNVHVDVKGEKTNLFSCPYPNTLIRYINFLNSSNFCKLFKGLS